jgi:1-acyl-sn-glycerol-3-phosphate acyltransferase
MSARSNGLGAKKSPAAKRPRAEAADGRVRTPTASPVEAGDRDATSIGGALYVEKTHARSGEHQSSDGGSALASIVGVSRSAVAGLAGAVAGRVKARVPVADLDDRDPDYIRDNLPGLWLLASYYFRARVRGLERIPRAGPVLLVGNHSGGNMTPDTIVFTLAFSAYFGAERCFYQLAHNLVLAMPALRFLRKYGTVAASHENAERALKKRAALLVYPGGDWEVSRPSWQSAKIDFGGRKGFISLALDAGVPIVPVVSIGGQETALFLSRGERLAKLLRLDRALRVKTLPVSLALPWGVNVGDFASHLPLPAKITIEVLEPIHLRERFGSDPDHDEIYDYVTGVMQQKLSELQSERRLPLIG